MFGLLRLQSSLLRHTMRLAQVYRRLDRGAAARNARAGRRLVEQVDLERQRLGRELHTGVGQALAAIRLQVELAAVQTPAAPPETRAALDRIGALTAQALDQVRAVSHRLHPPEWQRLGIADALAQLWEISGIAQKFEGSLELEPVDSEPPLAVKVLLYRTAQEALSNLTRHANATQVRMSLRKERAGWRLAVEDNGSGFDLERILHGAVSLRSGIGLRTIREQAESLDGDFRVHSGPAGTALEVWLPAFGHD
jgi:two-component system NarL family sensor kinase